MKLHILIRLVIFFTAPLLMSGSLPHASSSLQRELADLTRRGSTYRWLNDELIELTDPVSGAKQLKTLREPSEATVRTWAAARGVPILEIDPTQVDTSQYAGWYNYWTQVPLSNAGGGPLAIGDLDRNQKADVYGVSINSSGDFDGRIYEIDSGGTVTLRHSFNQHIGVSRIFADADGDSLREVLFTHGGSVYDFEQSSTDSLPTNLRFEHQRHYNGLDPGFTGIFTGLLDKDARSDLLYQGSEPDTTDSTNGITKTFIAEYNQDSINYVRVWSTTYTPGNQTPIAGFPVDDFDRDGALEFVATDGLGGRVFVTENVGDNSYIQTWQDSTPLVNLYFDASGDVDNDGKSEFFVGATMNDGTWVLVYEADSNNSYSARFMFHLLAAGTLDEPTFFTSDVNGDGKLEFVALSGVYLHIFRSSADNDYSLWYLRRENTKDAVQMYDLNGDGRQEAIISKRGVDSLGRGRLYADVYRATSLVSVREKSAGLYNVEFLQNYPNPFNASTTIQFVTPFERFAILCIYDLSGKELTRWTVKGDAGSLQSLTWDASHVSSGVYFYQLQTLHRSFTKKMLLLR